MSVRSASSSAHVRAQAAGAWADDRVRHAITDLFMADDGRLTDRTRAAVGRVLAGTVAAAEADVRRHAARLLAQRGATADAEMLLQPAGDVLARLTGAGLLRDPGLMAELIGRVELDLLAELLPTAIGEPDRPSLLVRLVECPDGVVAAGASALLAAESRRAGANRSELPAELQHRLLWWVTAAIRDEAGDGDLARDHALTEAAGRSLAAHDEGDRPEACAARLAAAIDARPDEIGALLVEAIGDRRPVFFTALHARAAQFDYEQSRELVLDPAGDLLWLSLHAIGLQRRDIARIGVALSDADPRRDLESLADAIDWAVEHDRDAARAALAPLALRRDLRAAVRALARGR